MTALWAFLKTVLPYAIAVAVAFAAVWYVYGLGVNAEHARRVAEVTALNASHTSDLLRISEANTTALAKAQGDARDKEAADQAAMAALDEKHFKELQDEKTNSQRTIDGLRNGTVRVRNKYACAGASDGSTGGGVPQASSGTSVGNGAAQRGFGIADATTVIGAADQGDGWATQLLACQAIVRQDRGQ